MNVNNWFHTALENIIAISKGGISWFKKSWMVLSMTGILIGAGIYVISLQGKQEEIKKELEIKKQEGIILQNRIDDAVKVNEANVIVMKQISVDKQRANVIVSNLNDRISTNNVALSAINKRLSTLEDGSLAPVLKETIRKLQEIYPQRRNKQ